MMEQLSLFDDRERTAPLASRLRPESLDEYVGQKHLVGPGKILRQLIERDQISSMIFWGPPGVGKTTLARIIARQTRAEFVEFSAVTSGIKEVKEVMAQAEQNRRLGIRNTGLTRPSRMPFFLMWKRAVSFLWEPLRKIPLLRSIPLCCPGARCLS